MSIKGFQSQEKALQDYQSSTDQTNYDTRAEFVTIQKIGSKKFGLDLAGSKCVYDVTAGVPDTVEANPGDRWFTATAHGAREGDVIKWETGNNAGVESPLHYVPDADTIVLGHNPPAAIVAGDTFSVLRHVTMRTDSDGSISIAGLSTTAHDHDDAFVAADAGQLVLTVRRDADATTVTADGDYAEFQVDATGFLKVSDKTLAAKTLAYDLDTGGGTEDNLGVGLRISGAGGSVEAKAQQASADSIPVVLSTEQEALIDGIEALLTTIDADTSSIATDASTIAGDTTSIDVKTPSLGQAANAASVPVTLSTEQEAMIDGLETALASIQAELDLTLVDTGYFRDLGSSAINNGAWTTVKTLTSDIKKINFTNNSGTDFKLAVNNTQVGVIPKGAAGLELSLRAVATDTIDLDTESGNATSGSININFMN